MTYHQSKRSRQASLTARGGAGLCVEHAVVANEYRLLGVGALFFNAAVSDVLLKLGERHYRSERVRVGFHIGNVDECSVGQSEGCVADAARPYLALGDTSPQSCS